MKRLSLVSVVLLVIAFLSLSRVEPVSPRKPLPDSKPTAMDLWLNKLKDHENCPAKGLIDSNGLLSYGPFCYQAGTFISFSRSENMFPYAKTDDEVMNYIYNPAIQRQLTRRILTDYPSYWTHWENSVKKIGLPPTLKLL